MICCLDMDGVLVDFMGPVLEALGIESATLHRRGLPFGETGAPSSIIYSGVGWFDEAHRDYDPDAYDSILDRISGSSGVCFTGREQKFWPLKTWSIHGMFSQQKLADACTDEFWESLPWTPDGDLILDLAEQAFGRDNVYIFSSPLGTRASGKLRWIEKHIPRYLDGHFMLGRPKFLGAGPGTVLIDDHDDNIDKFRRAGGGGILVPRIWNSAYARSWKTVQCVRDEIAAGTELRKD